ncbi:AraC-like DNA-binding protein [Chitinophaga niastensis]|uniref:AraC-like DNA-binding protein n=1 Tax=Chitinophaga niastensis TaxID=536980 RepID=A0A2P8HH99_CHINA|nr:AraC family transcriptional regulator [Chitinophaga niastensis]PSL45569.1 AraC-like DNA-binding protein [Chitinophaga niastensis]
MKPLVQKLPLNENTSFLAKTFRTPHFEVGWHQHIEYELILFTEGSGLSFIGNHVGEFETGDVYFLGANLPHTFQKREPELITSAVVVQFREDFWGPDFMQIPECRSIRQLLETSQYGLKITGNCKQKIQPLIVALEAADSFRRILILGECLEIIATAKEFNKILTQEVKPQSHKDTTCIDKVFQFTIDSFKDPISLSQVAAIACMSVPAFCNYFKRSTKKTYIDFLNEIRVGYACRLLIETQKPVLEICYESGYNTIANFHKQFLKLKSKTPLQYRLLITRIQASNMGSD